MFKYRYLEFKYRYLELQIDKEPRKVQGSQNSICKNDILKSKFL